VARFRGAQTVQERRPRSNNHIARVPRRTEEETRVHATYKEKKTQSRHCHSTVLHSLEGNHSTNQPFFIAFIG